MKRAGVGLAALALIASDARAWQNTPELLKQCCGLTANDLERLGRGEAIGRLVKGKDELDLGLLGAIRLSVSKEAFLEWYRNVDNFRKSPLVADAGRFHNPATPEDVERIMLDPNELKPLRSCQPGECSVKLSAGDMSRLKTSLDWTATDLHLRASGLAREWLLDRVTAYQKSGDQALGKYEDKEAAVDAAGAFRSLLDNSPAMRTAFPEVFRQLASYAGGLELKDEFIYWSREKYGHGLKPLLNVAHVTIYRPEPAVLLICSKQIWASHYYDASLGVSVLVDANPGSYLVYLNRSRIDLLRATGWKRSLVQWIASGSTKKEMRMIKQRVESASVKASGS